MSAALTLLPAVDVAGGQAVQVTGPGDRDPRAVARDWVDQGCSWLHLVDLDRAFGRGENAGLLAALVDELPVPVQLSGGIADDVALGTALATGAQRVVLSSLALRDPGWVAGVVAEHGERIAVGVDVRAGEVVARGTGERLGALGSVLSQVRGCGARWYVVADAARDGRRHGVDTDLFRTVAHDVDGEVIASGGVASLEDLAGLATLVEAGVTGVVMGAALYHGAFTLAEAMREVAR